MGKQTRRIWRGFLVMTKFPKGALTHFFDFVKNGRCVRGNHLTPKAQAEEDKRENGNLSFFN